MHASRGHFAHKHTEYFKQIDKDGDGFITRKEVIELLRLSKIPVSAQLVDSIFKACDTDNDGKISLAEFETYSAAQDALLFDMFRKMDPQDRGFISPEAFVESVHQLDPTVPDHTIKQLLEGLDHDGNAKIEFEEFVRYYHLIPISSIRSAFEFFQFESMDFGDGVRAISERPTGSSAITTVLSGAIAGAISRTTTAPIDRIKTFMMVQKHSKGVVSLFKELLEKDGVRGLFKGNGTNVVKIMPETAIKMLSYERIKQAVCKNPKNPSTVDRFLSGGIAGLVSSTTIYPMDLAKTRLALSTGKQYTGMIDCLYKVVKYEGPRGLFRGWSAGAIGGVPYAAVDLGVFNTLKDTYLSYAGKPPSAMIMLACGAISGICGQTVTYPLLVVRTRLINQKPGHILYSGMVDCLKKTYQGEGIKGLFRGLVPNYMKGVPAVSISYAVFEKSKELLTPHFQK